MPTRPFEKVRQDHATETAEDYIEAVSEVLREKGECRVGDLARMIGVSHVTVTRIVSRLRDEGYVEKERYRPIQLTAVGKRLAEKSRKRHETVLAFLLTLGVPEKEAEWDAEGIEHHVSEVTLKKMAAFTREKEGSE